MEGAPRPTGPRAKVIPHGDGHSHSSGLFCKVTRNSPSVKGWCDLGWMPPPVGVDFRALGCYNNKRINV